MSLQLYLHTIMPYLANLIEEKKLSTQNEQKVRLIIAVTFKHLTNLTKKITFYASSKNIEMRRGDNTEEILARLINSFLENYEIEENVLRESSNYSFECVDLTTIQFHSVVLRRGSSYIPSPE